MQFVSAPFLVFVALSLSLFHLARSLRLKRVVLFVSNLVFIALLTAIPRAMLPTGLFLAVSFALVRLVQARRWRGLAAFSLVTAVGAFAYLKGYPLPLHLSPLREPYSVIGLSYVLFRVIHLVVDSVDGTIRGPLSFSSFFNYCCFFPCWLSGPIQRYEDYDDQEQGLTDIRLSGSQVHDALSRIATGIFKSALLSAALLAVHENVVALRVDAASPVHFVVTFATAASSYTLYMYYNFAGYMDIVIGLAVFYGFRLPENFNQPFAARSFLEFWTRWHITLSSWFKAYVFNPSLRALAARWGNARSMPYLGAVAYFVTFGAMGIWHGPTPVFFVYGLLLGGGVSLNKLYEIEARKRLGKEAFGRLRANRLYDRLCQGAVFGYFTAALACLWTTPQRLQQLLEHPILMAGAYVGTTAVASAIFAVASLTHDGWDAARPRLGGVWESTPAKQTLLGVKIYAIALLILMKATTVPTFVYVRF